MSDYEKFINSKTHLSGYYGYDPIFIPDKLFDFQKFIVTKNVEKGRYATFADTGTGKTAMILTIAHNHVIKTNGRVLIPTPLAVAFQFLIESEKFEIPDVEYSKNGKYKGRIIIANYERLHYFDPNDFDSVLLDESSILKDFKGSTKAKVTDFMKKMKYRHLGTATPSPNDFIELGTSSEALGYMGYTDMLGRFFTNNEDSIDPRKIGVKWVLKAHAQRDFWKWVSSWSISIRKPSDLGFDDGKFILPDLHEKDHFVTNKTPLTIGGQHSLFPVQAKNFQEIRAENRATITDRCEKAVELAIPHECTVYWCNLNDEANLIELLDKNAVQIKGGMNIDQKEEILIAFSKGDIKKLITKPKITAFGLNWQHCNHTTYFPTYSYEQYYQAIRRFWRFGQQREVFADRILSDGQQRVLQSLKAKTEKANELFDRLNENLNSKYISSKTEFSKSIHLPKFLQNG